MNANLIRDLLQSLLVLTVLVGGAGSSASAAVFPCSEAGFLDAIAQPGGPHTFTCSGPTTIVMSQGTIDLDADVIVDGEGLLTLEAPDLFGFVFGQFEIRGTSVSQVPPVFDSADVEFRNLNLFGWSFFNTRLGNATLVLDGVRLENQLFVGPVISQGCNSPERETFVTIRNSEFFQSGDFTRGLTGFSLCSAEISNTTFRDFTFVFDPAEPIFDSGRSLFRFVAMPQPLPPQLPFVVDFENVTISGNTAATALIYADRNSVLRFRNSTFSNNVQAGSGNPLQVLVAPCILDETTSTEICDPVEVAFTNTILDGAGCSRVTRSDPSGSLLLSPLVDEVVSFGGNIEAGGDSCLFAEASDQVNVASASIGLLPLADYGGPTPTHALLPGLGTAAIDAGVSAGCPAIDQRGFSRPEPNGTLCDSGAVEYVPEPGFGSGLALGLFLLCVLGAGRERSPVAAYRNASSR